MSHRTLKSQLLALFVDINRPFSSFYVRFREDKRHRQDFCVRNGLDLVVRSHQWDALALASFGSCVQVEEVGLRQGQRALPWPSKSRKHGTHGGRGGFDVMHNESLVRTAHRSEA